MEQLKKMIARARSEQARRIHLMELVFVAYGVQTTQATQCSCGDVVCGRDEPLQLRKFEELFKRNDPEPLAPAAP